MLLLMDTGNVSVNKVRKMVCALSQGENEPQRRIHHKAAKKAANALGNFLEELKRELRKIIDNLF